MATSDDRLDLLLANADDGRPTLEEGMNGEAVQAAKQPKGLQKQRDVGRLRDKGKSMNLLPAQKWAVVAPKGKEGDAMLEAIAPLIRLREAEQGRSIEPYRVNPDMDATKSVNWKKDVYWSEDIEDEERPLYLCMLGDLNHISIELQHTLQNETLVGRVHFADAAGDTNLDGYAAYAQKVARYAKASAAQSEASPNLLFYVARDGTAATSVGRIRLVEPSLEAAQAAFASGKLAAAAVRQIDSETVDGFVAGAAGPVPSVLLSVSHGLGAPRRGWGSEEEQWRRQGALVVGTEEVLDAERLRTQPFLPGGIWFFLACFGAGTPKTSAYATWLDELSKVDAYRGSVAAVLKSLPQGDSRGFMAALPQAALLNPNGPLAVIGHMDLAWTYGFSDVERLSESRKSRIYTPLKELVRGSRAGVALDALMDSFRNANNDLTISYEMEKTALNQGRPDPTDRTRRGHTWMLRNDLRGYVLLGDPAVRLPLKENAAADAPPPEEEKQKAKSAVSVAVPASNSASVSASALASGSVSAREKAVLETLAGDEPPRVIAERAGVSLSILWNWVFTYGAGGRGRLDTP